MTEAGEWGRGVRAKAPSWERALSVQGIAWGTVRLGDLSGERVENTVSFRWSNICGLGNGSKGVSKHDLSF